MISKCAKLFPSKDVFCILESSFGPISLDLQKFLNQKNLGKTCREFATHDVQFWKGHQLSSRH